MLKGRVNWFDLDKKFGFVTLENGDGDAFLHMSVLKSAGYVTVPAGTTLQVRIERERNKRRVMEVLDVDLTTANPDEPAAILRKRNHIGRQLQT